MQVSQSEMKTIKRALTHWQQINTVTPEQSQAMEQSIQLTSFDWFKLAKYCFWIALACIIIAVTSALLDDALIAWFEEFFNSAASTKAMTLAGIASICFGFAWHRKKRYPGKFYSNEGYFFLGVLFSALSLLYLGVWFDPEVAHWSLLLLSASLVYGALGLAFPSHLVWLFAILSLVGWFGAETGYLSGWGQYYLGMNYPLRMAFFGLAIIALSQALHRWPARRSFSQLTLILGYGLLFMSLWVLSIFGNYGDLLSWSEVSQWHLLHWSALFAAVAITVLIYGIKTDHSISRGFALSFLLLNLYTRFFEYFWDTSNKALFFAILAFSFWLLGSKAESIWQLTKQRQNSSVQAQK
ncbi:DUF2157 domain-containing protein [Motilimonas pumila]|uniref:DUF2157 domain-containing protein n=1 Tax=Motilimonas pumila TaxID=2303987 RepID=A0A418YCX7_9GAMM|nr:DUF2157 domain-containing protein [Motilimonas pumila]RJG42331.1 DUF2157 domain-containing protein [Motilimonas pumila]